MATLLVFMCIAWAATVVCAIFIVYQRRIAWHCRGEQAITASIALQALAIVMQVPPFNTVTGKMLHTMTGQWNLEAFIGYGFALGSMGAIAYHFRSMIDDDDELARGFRTHVQLPAKLAIGLMFACLESGAGTRVDDSLFYLTPQDVWLKLYWVIFWAASVWILRYAVDAIRILRHYPSSRGVMTVYLCAAYSGGTAITLRTIQAIWHPWRFLHTPCLGLAVASVFGCAAMLLWITGAAWSWKRKIRWFNFDRREIDADN